MQNKKFALTNSSHQYIEKGNIISKAESDKQLYNESRKPYHENSHDMAIFFQNACFSFHNGV